MYVQTAVTIFNRYIDEPSRTDLYQATVISGASYWEALGTDRSSGVRSDRPSYKIRIPADAEACCGRTYLPAIRYADDPYRDEHWTIRHGDLVIPAAVCSEGAVSEAAVKELAASAGVPLITIRDYADNTGRGSLAVRHWRIGGE